MFLLNLVLRIYFLFLALKVAELLWRNLFPFWMAHKTSRLICSKLTLNFFAERLDIIIKMLHLRDITDKTWPVITILLYNKQKLLGMHIIQKLLQLQKKRPMKVTSTMFLFWEGEKLVVYQLLPNLAIGEDFGWLSSGSEPVSI